MKPTKVWVVFYNDGTTDGPMLFWNIWSTQEKAQEEADRMNQFHVPPWAEPGTQFEIEAYEVNPGERF